jgi:hypothetical protein
MASAPARSIIRAKPAVVNGEPRSDVKTNEDIDDCLALEPGQRSHFIAEDRMSAGCALRDVMQRSTLRQQRFGRGS